MTLLLAAPPKPVDPVYPTSPPGPGPLPGPHKAMARPDDMPLPPTSPAPPPPPTPKPGISIRIGRPPRLSRRERAARVFNQLGRYALAWGVTGWACYWVGDVHLFVPGLVIAALVANPRRPKRPVRPAHAGSGSRAVHSLLLRLSGRFGARGGRLGFPRT